MKEFVSYAHPDNLNVRFRDLKSSKIPVWAVDVKEVPASVTLAEVKHLAPAAVLELLAESQAVFKSGDKYFTLHEKPWNPLQDFNQAFQLAAKYELTINFQHRTVSNPHGLAYVYDDSESALLAIAKTALVISTQ